MPDPRTHTDPTLGKRRAPPRSEPGDTVVARPEDVPAPSSPSRRTKTRLSRQPEPERPLRLAPGRTIPGTQLQIVRWLGEGGMGVVFEVRHLDIERRYAAKLLEQSDSPSRDRRFRVEARTVSSIGSPHIVEVFDFKTLPDGRSLYLMELLGGGSAIDVLAEGPPELARVLAIGRQVCKGLHAAHELGIVHRDIKPDNLMLDRDARGRELIKIVDFGLASRNTEPDDPLILWAGSPPYMAPEQCLGQPCDARTDIYSLGATLYHLACGRPPFVADDQLELLDAHVHAQPGPPSAHAPEHRPLPASFDALVLECLAKDLDERPATAAAVEAGLIAVQLELGLQTEWDDLEPPDIDPQHSARLALELARLGDGAARARRRRWIVVGLGAFALAGLGAFALGRSTTREAEAEVVADSEVRNLIARARAAAARAYFVYSAPDEIDAETAYRALMALQALERESADEAAEALRAEFADTLEHLGDSYWDRPGGRSFARDFYAQAWIFDGERLDALERSGLSAAALADLRRRAATGDFDRHELAAVHPLHALAENDPQARLDGLVSIYADLDRLPASTAAQLERLIDELEGELPQGAIRVADLDPVRQEREGPARHRLHELARARQAEAGAETGGEVETGSEALDEDTGEPGEASRARRDPAAAAALVDRARAAYLRGRLDEAETLYHRALKFDGRSVAACAGLHRLHFDRGEYKEAVGFGERAVELAPRRAALHLELGDAHVKVLAYERARAAYERAAALGHAEASERLAWLDARLGREGDDGE